MEEPQFPNYPNEAKLPDPGPIPHGIPFADPKYQKPLYKLMKQMLKPKRTAKLKTGRKHKKRIRF